MRFALGLVVHFGDLIAKTRSRETFSMATVTANYQDCIEACNVCLADCLACVEGMLGKESMNDCPKCCLECAAICRACVEAMAIGGKHAGAFCKLCAEVCQYCADQCGAHDHDHCQKCAESCRRCAESCQAVAA
ncbi:four-helix bundle copper-binding protein [Pseudobythopirellula maris]